MKLLKIGNHYINPEHIVRAEWGPETPNSYEFVVIYFTSGGGDKITFKQEDAREAKRALEGTLFGHS